MLNEKAKATDDNQEEIEPEFSYYPIDLEYEIEEDELWEESVLDRGIDYIFDTNKVIYVETNIDEGDEDEDNENWDDNDLFSDDD